MELYAKDEVNPLEKVRSVDSDSSDEFYKYGFVKTPSVGLIAGESILRAQCAAAKEYPRNIAEQGYAKYQIDHKYTELQEQTTRLFCSEDRASVLFHEFSEGAQDFWPVWIRSFAALKGHLGLVSPQIGRDPWCRFLFVSAPSSRDQLKVTCGMFTLCCTYLQIMPEFLDLLMNFGKQSRSQHFYRSAFQHRTRLNHHGPRKFSRGLEIPNLGWSGRDLQVCYNWKSVERSSQGDWPWSIRDCAIVHSFDVESIRITWIVIKGNSLIQDRIQSATTDPNTTEMSSFQTLESAFASTLLTHLLICEWVCEDWDQYLDFIEAKSHEITRHVLSNDIDLEPKILKEPIVGFASTPKRMATGISSKSTASSASRVRARLLGFQSQVGDREKEPSTLGTTSLEAGLELPGLSEIDQTVRAEFDFRGQRNFRFCDLQELQNIHNRINEALLVLELAIDGFSQLRQYYEYILTLDTFPQTMAQHCNEDLSLFRSQTELHGQHLNKCMLRFRTLAGKVSSSIDLLYGIMDYQNVQSNKLLVSHSNTSNHKMEKMTLEMSDIARETKIETVSMKVITLVTLAFLPATFSSTLMSTEIFQQNGADPTSPNPYQRLTPVQTYLAITLPLTATTLSIWFYFHYRERASTELKKLKFWGERI